MLSHPLPPASAPGETAPQWSDAVGIFDLETTGTDTTRDRIVTAHVGILNADGEPISARTWLADPAIDIPDGASAIHGITSTYAREHGRPAHDVVQEILEELARILRSGVPVVAYNAAFDFSLLANEAARHGLAPLDTPAPIVDPLVIDKACDTYRRGKRTLDAVAAHYEVALDHAHNASADAIASGRIAQALAQRYRSALPRTAMELHTQQIEWAREQAESLTEYFVRTGRIDASSPIDGTWPVR